MDFSDLDLNKPILKAIFEKNYESPTEIQEKTIPLVLAKKDLIATAQTGTGKTAAFILPILQLLFHNKNDAENTKSIRSLIVSPTRELAVQINEECIAFAKYTGLKSTVVYGGTSINAQEKILNEGIDILIATPGRLLDLCDQEIIDLSAVEILVLDEADLMLDMGFIDDVKKINRLCSQEKQVLLFSATMPYKVMRFAERILTDPVRIEIEPEIRSSKKLKQYLYYVSKTDKVELCLHLLRNTIQGNILIFRRTRNGVDRLEQTLLKNGFKAEGLHGDKAQSVRQNILDNFKYDKINILIATDVASRGIDIDDLDAVLNFDLPNIPETYVHRIGRTGRAGKSGASFSFCAPDEKEYVSGIQKLIKSAIPVVEDHPCSVIAKEKPKQDNTKRTKHKKSRKSAASKKNKKRWY
jgi:ATP-dependent RNA helicase RhlE